jgi:hypothetical protein
MMRSTPRFCDSRRGPKLRNLPTMPWPCGSHSSTPTRCDMLLRSGNGFFGIVGAGISMTRSLHDIAPVKSAE